MSLQVFDALISLLDEFAVGRGVRTLAPSNPGPVPLAVGLGLGRGVLMRSETFAELGSAKVASASMVAGTGDVSRVCDGRVRLLGADVPELAQGAVVPFGVALIGAGAGLTPEDYERLAECQYVTGWIEGYMVRSRPGTVWARVSREAVGRGFDFAFLGGALRQVVRERVPHVTAVETLFVTSREGDIASLGAIALQCRNAAHELHRSRWSEKGVDVDCAYGGHCGACSDKETCDEVRKLTHMRTAVRREAEVA